MTHDLGELGKERAPVDLTFQWFGTTIRVSPDAGDLSLIDFMEQARGIEGGDTVRSMMAVKEFLSGQIDKQDWPLFLDIAKQHRQQFTDLMQVSKDIVTAVTLFPTGQLSESSNGQPSTGQRLRADSSSQGVRQAMTVLKGRPDLKMIVWQAQVAKAADLAA
jgi:hypothetical protein